MPTRKALAPKTMGSMDTFDTLIDIFKKMSDPRVARTRAYPLEEILFLVLAAVVSGVNHLTEIELFGEAKLGWFRTILPYENGIPSHDTIGRVLGQLDPDALELTFIRWMKNVAANIAGVVAIDGKTVRGAVRPGQKSSFIHMVSAFANANGLVYGQLKVDEKSNEITAIPQLLADLHLKGAIVTIDAMGCQSDIVDSIVTRQADFVIGVKANQPTLHDDLKQAFDEQDAPSFESEEYGHGRGEWRKCEVLPAKGHLTHAEKWKTVKTFIRVTSERRLDKTSKPEGHVRYFISSMSSVTAARALEITRAHWAIENTLHWRLDVSFREDECRVYAQNAAENLVVFRHIALNLLKSVKNLPGGIASKRSQAAWSDSAREKILQAELK